MTIREAAVAGMFYPDQRAELEQAVRNFLTEAATIGPSPKALILPHAGYVYSGAVAAAGYARVVGVRERVRRVVMLGPAHTVRLRGLAASTAEAFETPLGRVPIDRDAVEALSALPHVAAMDAAHETEHCLEVQLPFLQSVLAAFTLVPLVVGIAAIEQVVDVLERLWGGAETLIVVSSDLSHYHDYDTARRFDAATARAIEALQPEAIADHQACGRIPIKGLLAAVARRGLAVERLDLRNSGDTAGSRGRVVGYGAWAFHPADAAA